MKLIEDIAANLAATAVLAILAYCVSLIPARLLWQISHPHRNGALTIYTSVREPEPTRTYRLPVVGLGQVYALSAIVPSLVRAYRRRTSDLMRIIPADTSIRGSDLEGNLILLGGASRNDATRRLLERCEPVLGVRQRHGDSKTGGDRLFLRQSDGSWEVVGGMPIDGTLRHPSEDYALVVRIRNPWDVNEHARCLVFCGVHTYGTAAAARYFVRQWWKPWWWSRRGVLAIIRVELDEGYIIKMEKVAFRRL